MTVAAALFKTLSSSGILDRTYATSSYTLPSSRSRASKAFQKFLLDQRGKVAAGWCRPMGPASNWLG